MKKVFRLIFVAWAVFWWVATCLIVFVLYFLTFNLLKGNTAYRTAWRVTRAWAHTFLPLIGCRFKIHGIENINLQEVYIFASNHVSGLDIPVCMYALPVPFSFLGKKEALSIPVIGYLLRNGHIPIDRKDESSRRESYDNMVAHVSSGKSILLFVEGTRNKTNAPLAKFFDGAFKLAQDTQMPLIAVTLSGTLGIFTTRKEWFPIINIYFDRIDKNVEKPDSLDIEGLKKETAALMLKRLEKK